METPLSPKVTAGAAAGAASIILVWIASALGLDLPAEVASALTTLITAVAAWVARDKLRDAGQAVVTVAQAAPDTSVGDIPAVVEQTAPTDDTAP